MSKITASIHLRRDTEIEAVPLMVGEKKNALIRIDGLSIHIRGEDADEVLGKLHAAIKHLREEAWHENP